MSLRWGGKLGSPSIRSKERETKGPRIFLLGWKNLKVSLFIMIEYVVEVTHFMTRNSYYHRLFQYLILRCYILFRFRLIGITKQFLHNQEIIIDGTTMLKSIQKWDEAVKILAYSANHNSGMTLYIVFSKLICGKWYGKDGVQIFGKHDKTMVQSRRDYNDHKNYPQLLWLVYH